MVNLEVISNTPFTQVISPENAVSALPPGVQTQREIDAILDHKIWQSAQFENEKIIAIKYTESGYVVTTTSYNMRFEVNYLPPVNLGPALFKIEFDPSSVEKRLSLGSFGAHSYQLQKELDAILSDCLEELPFYSGLAIEEIQRTEKSLLIKTRDRTFEIGIEYRNNAMILNFR